LTRRGHFSDYEVVNVERLNGLSVDALYALSDKLALDLPPELDRVFVMEALLEAFEEDNEERRSLGDAAVHIEEKKYSGSELDEIDASLDAAPCLESRYNETVIHVIVKDPEWAFVFWDISDDEFDGLKGADGFSCLFLRVIKDPGFDGKGSASFDVVIGDDDDHWYLFLPEEDKPYRIDLYARFGARSRLLTHSAIVRTPRALVANSFSELESSATELAGLSGVASLQIVEQPERHPSRILSRFDE
jgi:uncharacterized protein